MAEQTERLEFIGCDDFPGAVKEVPALTEMISLFTCDGLTLCHFVRGKGDLSKKMVFIGRVEYG